MHQILFLDDDPKRHFLFGHRARRLLAGRDFRVIQTSNPRRVIELAKRLGPKLDAIFLDRDLGTDLTGEHVADALAKLPVSRRPQKIVVHSLNFFRAPKMVQTLKAAGYPVLRVPFQYG